MSFYRKVLQTAARTEVFAKTGIFVSSKAKACIRHFDGCFLRQESYANIKVAFKCIFVQGEEIQDLLLEMQKLTEVKHKIDFDSPNALSNANYPRLTGINKDQFNSVHWCMTSIKSSPGRCTRATLGLVLVKLRTGLSLPILSTLFGL